MFGGGDSSPEASLPLGPHPNTVDFLRNFRLTTSSICSDAFVLFACVSFIFALKTLAALTVAIALSGWIFCPR